MPCAIMAFATLSNFAFRIPRGITFSDASRDNCCKIPLSECLYNALRHHSLCHFEEAGDVRALYIVDVSVLACAVLDTCTMYVMHDFVQHLVNLLAAPVDFARILAHFKA